jgi:hypothetical protein
MEFLKVREEKYRREHGGAQVESGGRECAFLLQVLLKLTVNQAPVAHACNPCYSGGRDQEDRSLKPAQAK